MNLKPILEIANKYGILKKELEIYGDYKAKIKLEILERLKNNHKSKYVVVTGITPTILGEGKTTTTIGISMSFSKLHKKSITCIRQPSIALLFGLKGMSSGGKAKVLPQEDFNTYLNYDFYCVSTTHNLCMSFLNNYLYRKKIKLDKILFKYVFDLCDRFLRNVKIGLDIKDSAYFPLNTSFDIVNSSEIMSILSFSKSICELNQRLKNIVLGFKNKKPVTLNDLKIADVMTFLLKDAIKPNLLQTSLNDLVFVHTGAFANISHGNSSIIADLIALKLADYVITESGFGADCGFEKFINIKCRYSGLKPDCVVLVCTTRGLKMNSRKIKFSKTSQLISDLEKKDLELLEDGLWNLKKQIENVKIYGLPVIVCINKFDNDSEEEIKLIERKAKEYLADEVAISEIWQKGEDGGIDLVKKILKITQNSYKKFKFLYPLDYSIKEKIFTIAKNIYGAKDVSYTKTAIEKIKLFTSLGWDKLPICIAKTQFSLSHDPNLKFGDFIFPIVDIIPQIGAGFLVALSKNISTMPSLPKNPNIKNFYFDKFVDIKCNFV